MNILSNSLTFGTSSVLCLALVAASVSSRACAQQSEPQQPERAIEMQKPTPRFVRQDSLIGSTVTSSIESEHKVLGKITDLIFDRQSGLVIHAVLVRDSELSAEKKQTLLPWSDLSWNHATATFTSKVTASQLDSMQAFEPAKIGAANKQLAQATTLGKCEVTAQGTKIGTCGMLFVETNTGSTAFTTVTSTEPTKTDEVLIVPWSAMQFAPPTDDGAEQVRIDVPASALSLAPWIKERGVELGQAEFRRRIYDFFAVPRPKFEPQNAGETAAEATARKTKR